MPGLYGVLSIVDSRWIGGWWGGWGDRGSVASMTKIPGEPYWKKRRS